MLYGLRPDYSRVNDYVIETLSHVGLTSCTYAAGGRLRFASSSPVIKVKITLGSCNPLGPMTVIGAAGCDVYIDGEFIGAFGPSDFGVAEYEFSFKNTGEQIQINLPIAAQVLDTKVECDDIRPAKDYTIKKPVVFYGSSITNGIAASRPGNTYPAILSRRLDCDYYNYGMAGSCRGEVRFAEYICENHDMSMLLIGYDHNALNVEELEERHERFFKTVRKYHPELPVLILSKPDLFNDHVNNSLRRDVIYRTYSNAQREGDKNVYFLDGAWMYNKPIPEMTADGLHPHDETFVRFADILEPIIRRLIVTE
ncbi:MAG: hypothetical protein IJA55_03400 [Clostridia bacterium]|nr:hypothetical protein [Clostridia bacterium]